MKIYLHVDHFMWKTKINFASFCEVLKFKQMPSTKKINKTKQKIMRTLRIYLNGFKKKEQ